MSAIESVNVMHLELTFGSHFCYTPTFRINGVNAEHSDFGDKFDRDWESAEEYSCGNMQFTRRAPEPGVLAKYNITIADYESIAEQLERGLSFGACGWCV